MTETCWQGLLRAARLAAVVAALATGCANPKSAAEPRAADENALQYRLRFSQAESQLRSADAATRRQAAVALLSMDYPAALQSVLDHLRHADDPAVRVSMIRAAGFCADHRCFDAVLDAVNDPDPEVQKEAATALTRFTLPGEVDAVVAVVGALKTTVAQRQLLYAALGDALSVRAVPVLLAGLQESAEGPRQAAWEALRKISGRQLPLDLEAWQGWWAANSYRSREDVLNEHLQAVRQELQASAAQVKDLRDQQDALMKVLASAQGETAGSLLIALGGRHELVRLYASSRLAALDKAKLNGLKPDEAGWTTLAAALSDPSVAIRRNVIRFVVQLEGERRDELVGKSLDDEDPAVLTTAIEAVRAGAGRQTVARLEALVVQSPRPQVRETAANALGTVGLASSASVLMKVLDDAEENVRWFAVEGLRKLGAVQAVPKISEMLVRDGSARVREIAASTLGELGQPAGVPALRAALGDRNDRVREKAVSALTALATGDHDRMMIIAAALKEHGLLEPAAEVLTRAIAQLSEGDQDRPQLTATYRQLAEVRKAQGDYAAAGKAYERVAELTGGGADALRELADCWVQAGEPARAVGIVDQWLGAAAPEQKGAVLELALDVAEALVAAQRPQEAGQVLDLVAKHAGAEPGSRIVSRMERLRRRIGS